MSIAEMKRVIINKVDSMDEQMLKDILDVVNKKENNSSMIDATEHLDYLFQKHDGLLKRLA